MELIKNKYYRIYKNIYRRAKKENRKKLSINSIDYVYYENHHIIPRSIYKLFKRTKKSKVNSKTNMVLLTAREHFIMHACLTRFLTKEPKWMMVQAMLYIVGNKEYTNSKIYEINRTEYIKGLYHIETNGLTRVQNRGAKCSATKIKNRSSKGQNNSKAKKYVFIDKDNNEMFCSYGNLRGTCKEYNIAYSQACLCISLNKGMYEGLFEQEPKIKNTNIAKLTNSNRLQFYGWRICELSPDGCYLQAAS